MSATPRYDARREGTTTGQTQHGGDTTTLNRYDTVFKTYWVTGMLHLMFGTAIFILGMVAIVRKTWYSYFATPVWMGLLIFLTTGILGVLAGTREKRSLGGAYMAMSIFSLLASFSLIFVNSFAAVYEVSNVFCHPKGWGPAIECNTSVAGRRAINGLIAVLAFFELLTAIISSSWGCCFVCSGCGECCRMCCSCCIPPPPATSATFLNGGGVAVPVALNGVSQGGNIIVQGGSQQATQYTNQPQFFVIQQGQANTSREGAGAATVSAAMTYPPSQVNAGFSLGEEKGKSIE